MENEPISKSDAEREGRQRKRLRSFVSFGTIVLGIVLVFCYRQWRINGIYAPYLGCAIIALGVLGLLGVNVFWGGPLDKRRN
jgi:hypothetical protein